MLVNLNFFHNLCNRLTPNIKLKQSRLQLKSQQGRYLKQRTTILGKPKPINKMNSTIGGTAFISDSRIATNEGSAPKTLDRTSTIEHSESKTFSRTSTIEHSELKTFSRTSTTEHSEPKNLRRTSTTVLSTSTTLILYLISIYIQFSIYKH